MRKNEYLEEPEIQLFITWLSGVARNEVNYQFSHQYESETKGQSTRTITWKCNSLFDAYQKYDWPFSYKDLGSNNVSTKRGSSYDESELVLANLSKLLLQATEEKDNDLAFNACAMVLDWGGVLGSVNTGNLQKLVLLKPYLFSYLVAVKGFFESPALKLGEKYEVRVLGESIPIIMSAGFTKIYSLLCDDFIIYDGRVGASFGLLVRMYYERNAPGNAVSKNLLFHYGKAKNRKVNRNPSTDLYEFKPLSTSMKVHIEDNVKANWIIQELLGKDCGEFNNLTNPGRCLEAALFMIGYRI